MDYYSAFQAPLSKLYIDNIVMNVFRNPDDFSIVYGLIFDSNINVSWRAAWACQKISSKHPEWFGLTEFIALTQHAISTSHAGIRRGCLGILIHLPIPPAIPVEFINSCFDWMVSPRSAIAVQALSMKLLQSVALKEPAFRNELIACLEYMDVSNYSSGFICARRSVLKSLISKSMS